MARTLLRARGVTLHAYPTMFGVGCVAGIIAATLLAPWLGLAPGRTYAAFVILLIPALLGSRILHVAVRWREFRSQPHRLWRTSDGGMALYGGLALMLLTSVLLLPVLRLPVVAFWDAAAVVILIGMAFTKVGCHLNGCCAGRPSTGWLAIELTNSRGERARRVPTQLLESALAVLLLALALWTRARFELPGSLFLVATTGYGFGRFVLEGARESVDRIGGVSVHRTISAALSATSALFLWLGITNR